MKNVKFFLVFFFLNLLFLTSTNCYGSYHLELNDPIDAFFEGKSKKFMVFLGTNQLIERTSKDNVSIGEISNKLKKFNTHNDREELDCCEICYFVKILNDKKLCFSGKDKQIILQALEILTTWFIRNSPCKKDMEEAKKLFQNFDLNKLFIFVEDISIGSCTLL